MRIPLSVILPVLLLLIYVFFLLNKILIFFTFNDPILWGFAALLLIFPLFAFWVIFQEILFGLRGAALERELTEEQKTVFPGISRTPGGRLKPQQARDQLPRYRSEATDAPGMYRLAIVLRAQGDKRQARQMMVQAMKANRRPVIVSDVVKVNFSSEMQVELVKHSARDEDVVFAARVSTLGSDTVQETAMDSRDVGLINFLMRDRHGSPFEHNSMTFRIQAPIFVFREFMRHRMASYNEESGRYRQLEPLFYLPAPERKLVQVGKPGAYVFEDGTKQQHELVVEEIKQNSQAAYASYERMLAAGIAREVARAVLPVNLYSTMYVTMNARSLMNFLSLRTKREDSRFPSYPQREIEMCAEAMEEIWRQLMPATHAAFEEQGRVAP